MLSWWVDVGGVVDARSSSPRHDRSPLHWHHPVPTMRPRWRDERHRGEKASTRTRERGSREARRTTSVTRPIDDGIVRGIPNALTVHECFVAPASDAPPHEWDVDIASMLKIDRGVVPATTSVRNAIQVDPLLRAYTFEILREAGPG